MIETNHHKILVPSARGEIKRTFQVGRAIPVGGSFRRKVEFTTNPSSRVQGGRLGVELNKRQEALVGIDGQPCGREKLESKSGVVL